MHTLICLVGLWCMAWGLASLQTACKETHNRLILAGVKRNLAKSGMAIEFLPGIDATSAAPPQTRK